MDTEAARLDHENIRKRNFFPSWQANVIRRIRNRAKLRALELVDPRNSSLRNTLQKAEFAITAGNDVVHEGDEDGATGSASDSEWRTQ